MPQGQVLEFSGATKRFGGVTAVSELTARVEPGLVTGFLGPNGAGKTTSLRMLLGLVRPTSGTATIDGVRYAKLKHPLQTVGAVLEASSFHPGRTGAGHLRVYAQAAGLPKARVDEVLGLVGLADAAGRKVGGYSLGMRQRLGLAYALLGDPGVLVLDEPTNGLDPEGIRWIRGFLRQLAREGRTVLVSSHLLTEVQQTVDALLIISAGRLVFQGGLDELTDPSEQATVVDSTDRAALAEALRAADIPFEVLRSGLTVRGIEPAAVGLAAAAAGVPLTALQKRGPALEEIFLDLANGTRVHASAAGAGWDDVIPAIESGTIAAVEPVEDESDAAAAAPAAAEVVDVDEVDEVAELAVAEPAVTGEPDDDEPEAEEPSTRTASFAVASTGVIDIVPVGDNPPVVERAERDETPETPEDDDEAGDAEAEAEAVDEFAETDNEDDPVGEDGEADDERPWEDYVRTDADDDADRFFAAFDTTGGTGEAEPTDDAEVAASDSPDDADPAEPPGEQDHPDDGDDDTEGGERR